VPSAGPWWAPAALGLGAYLPAVLLLAGVLLGTSWWYGFFDLADAPLYHDYATRMDQGLRPFVDFPAEYPPLAMRLLALPTHPADLGLYAVWFAVLMLAAMALAAVLVTAVGCHPWTGWRRPARSAVVFSGSVLALGAIVANRLDAVVALAIAAFLWAAARRRWTIACLALGLGTAFKLVPVILLPLPLLFVPDWRTRGKQLLAFAAGLLPPFLLEGTAGLAGLLNVFRFHGARPLQIESVLATPLLLASMARVQPARIATAFGSQVVAARGAGTLALLSGPLAVLLLLLVYALAWRARRSGRLRERSLALAVTAALLAFLVPAKVLSPQYMVWLIPGIALLSGEVPGLAAMLGFVLLATQIEFPSLYFDFVDGVPFPVGVVAARNLALAGALAWALWKLARPAKDGA
jgi:hypothetical protein